MKKKNSLCFSLKSNALSHHLHHLPTPRGIRDTEGSRINFEMPAALASAAVKVVIYKPLVTLPTSTPVSRKKGKKPLELASRECRPGSEEQGEQCINSGTPPE